MHVTRGRLSGKVSELRGETFTGRVHLDPVLSAEDLTVNSVFFEPAARTFWHRHSGGQILFIHDGQGYVVNRAGDSALVRAGDVIYTPAGEEHWHGAGRDTFMIHVAVSMGATEWLEEVENPYPSD
jgi:quercetin dioxygenase-like cupin family protein